MRNTTFILTALLAAALFSVACGGTTAVPANKAATADNSDIAKENTSPLAAATAAPEQTTNTAPTLTPVYKAYCAAWVKKDEAGLRKVYSTDTIRNFESEMKADFIKTLVEYLSDDQVSNELCEVRNEQITGETAVAEIRTQGYPNGIKVVFAKEGGEWKLTNKRPSGALQ